MAVIATVTSVVTVAFAVTFEYAMAAPWEMVSDAVDIVASYRYCCCLCQFGTADGC